MREDQHTEREFGDELVDEPARGEGGGVDHEAGHEDERKQPITSYDAELGRSFWRFGPCPRAKLPRITSRRRRAEQESLKFGAWISFHMPLSKPL